MKVLALAIFSTQLHVPRYLASMELDQKRVSLEKSASEDRWT